jgi:predicted neuraminidase
MQVARKSLLILTILLVYGRVWLSPPFVPGQPAFQPPTPITGNPPPIQAPLFESRFASHGVTKSVHSASLVEVSGGKLRAFWYGGTREGARDVVIYSSLFTPETGSWTEEKPAVTRERLERDLSRYIKKLGNPVALVDRDRMLRLFFVSVSVGGWSGSSINFMVSGDEGVTWDPPRRLITSPFLNLSTLVKGPPLSLQDGSPALPAYHELLGVFGEVLRLDNNGRVIGKHRLSHGTHSLQPVVVPWTSTEAIGLMRYAGPPPARITSVRTTDAGRHWTRPVKTDLPNPNAAITCTALDDGALLLVFNNSESKRDDLSMAHSTDFGETWRIIHSFEETNSPPEGAGHELSYPYLIRASNGDFHLLFTWHRTHIKHIRFNEAWLEQKLK